jgi:hypothetical protein
VHLSYDWQHYHLPEHVRCLQYACNTPATAAASATNDSCQSTNAHLSLDQQRYGLPEHVCCLRLLAI